MADGDRPVSPVNGQPLLEDRPFTAGETAREYYHSTRWLRLRSKVLRRDGYMCQYHKRYGRMVQANTVHHIFPRDEYPEYEWQAWNLISLSSDAHDQMHDRNTGMLTDKGIDLLKRIARQRGMDVPLRYQ